MINDIINEEEEGLCPFVDDMIGAILFPKPFGLHWDDEIIAEFLKKLGYKIIGKTIAIKPGDKDVPEYDNLMEVFNNEAQKIMTKWLLKINTES